jgi:hypothetical protein
MASPSYDDQNHNPSIVAAMVNPITQLKYQYLGGAWSIPTYYAMRQSGNIALAPFYTVTTMMPWLKKYGSTAKTAPWHQKALAFAVGKYEWSLKGSIESVARSAGMNETVLPKFTSELSRNLTKYVTKNRWKNFGDLEVYNKVLSEVTATGIRGPMGAGTPESLMRISSAVRTTQVISRIGATVTPILTGIALGEIAANAMSLWFKGSMAALDYANAKIESMRTLEMGGGLGAGYRTAAAVTERQRAVRELARTPINASRMLGNEASIYSSY